MNSVLKHIRSRYVVAVGAGIAAVGLLVARFPAGHPTEARAASAGPLEKLAVVCLGHVDMEHGVTSLFPVLPGQVTQVPVEENQHVKAGTVLVQLDDRAAELRVRQAEAVVKVARNRCKEAEKLVPQHALKVKEQEGAVRVARERLRTTRIALERKQELTRAQQVNPAEAEAAAAAVREAEAVVTVEEDKLHELQLSDPGVEVEGARAELAAKQADLDLARQAVEQCKIRAPRDGLVLRVLTSVGDLVSTARQPAVLFCAEEKRIVRAEVEQEFASHVAEGQTALIEDDTRAGNVWHGKVTHVSDWFTHRRSILPEPMQFNDVRTLECIIVLDPGQPPLRIGQRVRVRINET